MCSSDLEGNRLAEVLAERPFVVTETAAAAAGVTLAQVDLSVEIRPTRGGLRVSGLYLARSGKALHELAPLTTVMLRAELRAPGGDAGPTAPATSAPATSPPGEADGGASVGFPHRGAEPPK